jgi:hypothetical protein
MPSGRAADRFKDDQLLLGGAFLTLGGSNNPRKTCQEREDENVEQLFANFHLTSEDKLLDVEIKADRASWEL